MSTVERTHEVFNQAPPLQDYNAFESDLPLREALDREGGGWGVDRARDLGSVSGSAKAQEHARRAERNDPRLLTHDRWGNSVDHIDCAPSCHWLVSTAVEQEIPSLTWREPRAGAHVVRCALFYLWGGVNAGAICPVSMS